MAKILKSKRSKLAAKLKTVKCYIYSIFTYGCEAWTLSKVLEAKIEAFEMWYLRELGNVMWKDKVRETKRAPAEQLDGGHLPASLRLHQPSCRARPVECHYTSTVEEAMTLPDTRYQIPKPYKLSILGEI